MVDLNTYRVRIGTFKNDLLNTKSRRTLFQRKKNPHQHPIRRGSGLKTLVILWVMTAAVAVCIPLLHQARDSVANETNRPAVGMYVGQPNPVKDSLVACLWKGYHSFISRYRMTCITLKTSTVSCDSVLDKCTKRWRNQALSHVSCKSITDNYKKRCMTLPLSAVFCYSFADIHSSGWRTMTTRTLFCNYIINIHTYILMTLSPSATCFFIAENSTNLWMIFQTIASPCDYIVDNYADRWTTSTPSFMSCNSVIDTYTRKLISLVSPAVSCDSITDNYGNRWMTLTTSPVSCNFAIDNYTKQWMTQSASAVSSDSFKNNYKNGWMTLLPSAVSCDSFVDIYKNGWKTLTTSLVSCDSGTAHYTNGWMTLLPSTVSCDSFLDMYKKGWMTQSASAVSCDSFVDIYKNGWKTLTTSLVTCNSGTANYTNEWMTLLPSYVSCDSFAVIYKNRWNTPTTSHVSCDYSKGWMTLPPLAIIRGSVVNNYINRWMTLTSLVPCDFCIDNYTNGWMTLSSSAVSCDSIIDNYANRWMTLPPSAVSCVSGIDNDANGWMTQPVSAVTYQFIKDNYKNVWMTKLPSAISFEKDIDLIRKNQSQRTCHYLIGNLGLHVYNGNPPMHGGEEEDIQLLHCEMVNKLSDLAHPDIGHPWKKLKNMLKVYFSSKEISGSDDIFTVCEILKTKGKLKHGQYEVLTKIFNGAGLVHCCKIVEEYSQRIEGTQMQPLSLSRRKRSSNASPDPQRSSSPHSPRLKMVPGKVDLVKENIGLVYGSLELEQVDVIVCEVDSSLNPTTCGRAAKCLFAVGGDSLMAEYKTRFPNGIEHGQIVAINGGNLKCKKLYLFTLPVVLYQKKKKKKNKEKNQLLRTAISSIVNKAIEENARSLAIPAIGISTLNMSTDDVAHTMFDTFSDTRLNVKIVLQDKTTMQVLFKKDVDSKELELVNPATLREKSSSCI